MSWLRVLLARLHAEEDGLSAGAEALAFGVLVFVVGSIIGLNGWAVLDAKFAVNAAAREATRSIVEGGAVDRASMLGADGGRIDSGVVYEVAVETMAGHGKDPAGLPQPSDFVVALADDPWTSSSDTPQRPRDRRGTRSRGSACPGGWQTPITAQGQHTEIIDPFRSGLAGRADCA